MLVVVLVVREGQADSEERRRPLADENARAVRTSHPFIDPNPNHEATDKPIERKPTQ